MSTVLYITIIKCYIICFPSKAFHQKPLDYVWLNTKLLPFIVFKTDVVKMHYRASSKKNTCALKYGVIVLKARFYFC